MDRKIPNKVQEVVAAVLGSKSRAGACMSIKYILYDDEADVQDVFYWLERI